MDDRKSFALRPRPGSRHRDAHASSSTIQDDRTLIKLGKKPVLKRTFGLMSVLGFSCTVLITWEGILVVSTQALINGGPAGVIWGFLIVWLGTCSTFGVIAELASMAPIAGGQYHWVAMLAPSSNRNLLSYITAWTTIAGWQAVTASTAYLVGTQIQGVVAMTHPEYGSKPWHTMLLFWAVMFFAVFINSVTSRTLARFEGVILVVHLFGFFAVLIPLVYFGPHGDGSIFTTFLNGGGWPTQSLSFFVGLPAAVFSLIGADGAVHMSEEIQAASLVVPRALMLSLLINGVLGFAMILALMFCIGDLQAALDSQETLGYPFLEIFLQAVKSKTGATLMASIIIAIGICCVVGAFATSSRMLWSFSRDHGTPGWRILVKLDPRTSIPINTIAATTIISMLLSLIVLGSSVAFNNIVSLSVAGLYSSYLLTCALLLWRRLGGKIKPHSDRADEGLQWGPWRLLEPYGTLNNTFACIYLVLLLFWTFWPPAIPVTPSTMNFSCLVFGSTILFSVGWYMYRGRKEFTGPVVEVDAETEFN